MAWAAWLLATAFVVYLFGFQTGYAIVNPSIQAELKLTVAQVSTVAATYTWVFAFCQFFSGALLDKLGARKVLLPAIAFVTTGIALASQAGSYPVLIAAQFVIALGACAGFVGAGYVGGQGFGMARFSFMFGLVQFSASLFSAFGQTLFVVALEHLTWRALFLWTAAVGVLLFVLAWMLIRNPKPGPSAGSASGAGAFFKELAVHLLQVARLGRVWLFALWGAMVFGAMLAAGVVWAPKLLILRGMAPDTAALASSILWLGLAAGCLALPKWSDLKGRRKLPALVGIGLQLAALSALLYLPAQSTPVAMSLCFVFGFGAAAHMLAFSMAGDTVPPELIGAASAVVNGVMFLFGGVLIALPGQIVAREESVGMPVSMLMGELAGTPVAIGLAVAMLIVAFLPESFNSPKD